MVTSLKRGSSKYLFSKRIAVAALCVSALSCVDQKQAITVELLADSNRDGIVDSRDRENKLSISLNQGAIILPNIGDKHKRCPKPSDSGVSDAELEACHDAQDNQPHAPEFFAPLIASPATGLSDDAYAFIHTDEKSSANIRIFIEQDGKWDYVDARDKINAEKLRHGLKFGVDARDIVRDSSIWNGQVVLTLSVINGNETLTDQVAMQVAPLVTHNHLQAAVDIYAPINTVWDDHERFIRDLDAGLKAAGFDKPMARINASDNWAQDYVEFAHLSMPQTDGQLKSIRVAIRSPQPTRIAGRELFALRGPGFGVVQIGGDNYHQADSFGNLETIPPYSFDGKHYPAGRVIYGDAGDGLAPHQDWQQFFASQPFQSPIRLDTSWLIIAHVDEFLQFIPSNTERGWKLGLKDVASGLALLSKAQSEGYGEVLAFSGANKPSMSIAELLADSDFLEINERAKQAIEKNLEILKRETGLTESEIVRIPGLFQEADFTIDNNAPASKLPPHMNWPGEKIYYGEGRIIAFYPAAVNGVFLDHQNYIVPKQWGPVINGEDILQNAVDKVYQNEGIQTWPVDDWSSHHSWGGEIHCGTNATRDITPWWQ